MLRKVNLNTCIGKAWGLIDDETGATFWPTNAGAAFNANNARFRVAGVDLATLYAAAANDYMLIAKDTADKAAKGYIDVADDAEALGAELLTTSDDSDFTVWENVNWVGSSGGAVADGTGKLECTMDSSGTCGTALSRIEINGLTVGKHYKFSIDVWAGTTIKTAFNMIIDNNTETNLIFPITISGDQATFTKYFVATDTDFGLVVNTSSSDSGTFFIDDASVKEVTNVGTDGVLIMSAKGGTTQSWTSQDAGIDLNDIATFEVLIAK